MLVVETGYPWSSLTGTKYELWLPPVEAASAVIPLERCGWARGGRTPEGKVLTNSLFAVPGASHEVCVWRISPLVPGGPVHGGLREGKAQDMLEAAHSPSGGAGGATLYSFLPEAGRGWAMIQKYCPATDVNLQGMRGTKSCPQTPV